MKGVRRLTRGFSPEFHLHSAFLDSIAVIFFTLDRLNSIKTVAYTTPDCRLRISGSSVYAETDYAK